MIHAAAKDTKCSVVEVRVICLDHQISALRDELASNPPKWIWRRIKTAQLARFTALREDLSRSLLSGDEDNA